MILMWIQTAQAQRAHLKPDTGDQPGVYNISRVYFYLAGSGYGASKNKQTPLAGCIGGSKIHFFVFPIFVHIRPQEADIERMFGTVDWYSPK